MAIIKVIAIFGQSNIDGRNAIADLPVDVTNPNPNVKFYIAGEWRDYDCTVAYPRFTTGQSYAADTIALSRLANNRGENIYFVKNSRGGTAFFQSNDTRGDWNIDSIAPEDHYWKFTRRLRSTKKFIEYNGDTMDLVALWSDIGESDSALSDKATFKTDYTNFVNEIKTIAGKPNLPIIDRQMGLAQGVNQWMIDAKDELSNEIPNYNLIPYTFTLFDGVHLDPASTNDYANSVLSILENLYA